MAATKRNAGLTSAVPRATLNDEDLVCRIHDMLTNEPQHHIHIFRNAIYAYQHTSLSD